MKIFIIFEIVLENKITFEHEVGIKIAIIKFKINKTTPALRITII